MLVRWSPQRSDRKLAYSFEGEVIIATLDGHTDAFDFRAMPDGEAGVITSSLEPCPVLSARRTEGQLEVTLLRFHGPDAPYEERFPEPEVIE